jgi:threonine dehydrogenase-like Zn-dependent dehydrogenase
VEQIAFSAPEYQADGSIRTTAYAFAGTAAEGWEIRREGQAFLRLGPGYRLLRVSHCGVCATDLARRHLPFPLPQVTGHEVVGRDDRDRLVVVEINASHAARGLPRAAWCAHCRSALATHCPERLVLGIHDLPGGFAPWLLAPVENVLPLPAAVSPATAALVEPFAAAWHAVATLAPDDAGRVAVLGAGRLGTLVVAALAEWRARSGGGFGIVAVGRRGEARLRALGADEVLAAEAAATRHDIADVVVEATGSPDGLALAAQLATREVHVKSTTGRAALGLSQLTALVVDEVGLVPYRPSLGGPAPSSAAILGGAVPAALGRALERDGTRVFNGDDAAALARAAAADARLPLGGTDLVVVTSLAAIDAAIRPVPGVERGLVRARGTIAVADVGQPRQGLLAAVLGKGLRLSTSRCGDFRAALEVLADPVGGLGRRLGDAMVTDIVPAEGLAEAFATAAAPSSVKVVVTHAGASL